MSTEEYLRFEFMTYLKKMLFVFIKIALGLAFIVAIHQPKHHKQLPTQPKQEEQSVQMPAYIPIDHHKQAIDCFETIDTNGFNLKVPGDEVCLDKLDS